MEETLCGDPRRRMRLSPIPIACVRAQCASVTWDAGGVNDDVVLERVKLPDGKEMVLTRWESHVAISVGGRPLMSTHEHGSEDELGRVVAERLAGVRAPRMLIGGLGLGYTLRAALDVLPQDARVVVAELVPAVVRWNKAEHGAYSGHPLRDRRVKLVVEDVGKVIAKRTKYDAILLDVDNGPDALSHDANAKLYKRAGLLRTKASLRPGGVLAVWSAFPSKTFTRWLSDVGFGVEQLRATPTTPGGPRYYIWLATNPRSARRAPAGSRTSAASASPKKATSGRGPRRPSRARGPTRRRRRGARTETRGRPGARRSRTAR